MRVLVFFAMLLGFSTAAHAEWLEASSDHFVIYAEDTRKDITRFSEELERYHAAMEYVTGQKTLTPSPSNRVTIYVVNSTNAVQKLYSGKRSNVAGFYQPRAGGSVAFVPRVKLGGKETDFSMIVLMHEYAHHYLISSSSFGMPRWFSEGAAEFYSAASFEKDGGVILGRPAMHRAYEIKDGRAAHVRELFEYDKYKKNRGKLRDTFYGKSWLLYHYMIFDQERAPQMRTYLIAMAKGASEVDAAREAFGDFNELEKELDSYARKRKMRAISLEGADLPIGKSAVRPLTEGEAAMMPLVMRSKRGVDEEQAAEVVVEMRRVANRYRRNAYVQTALAEAEYDAGNDEAAIAAADAALAIDPSRTNAYVQKGYALFRIAEGADDQAAAYNTAREPFLALNKIEPDHPLPLSYYYRSFVEQGVAPPAVAKTGLARAVQVAPFDLELRMNLATLQIQDGDFARARVTLAPVAVHPHADDAAETARKMIAKMDEDPDWDGVLPADDEDTASEEDGEAASS